ncbi:Ig-like domain-containing protein, partial [Flavobacterium aciduliphilum]
MKKLFLLFFLMIFSLGQSQTLSGTWKVTSIGVGPNQGDIGWWSLSVNSGERACFFDDTYVFNENGTFQNVQGNQTWVEGWQGGSDSCGTPVAPHNGLNAATYSSTSTTLTLLGVGAYIGLAKAVNGSELSSPNSAPSSVTYQISSLTSTTLTLDINVGGAWWCFQLAKQGAIDSTPAAPSPTIASSNVIKIYNDSFIGATTATIDTYRTSWSSASLENVLLSGNNTLKYTNLGFVGIEAVTSPINATNMNIFHIDMYTPNMTTFGVKLVDFGADASYGGGDDVEHQINLTPTQNGWNSYNLLLSDFTSLTTRAHIAQIILVGNGTAYVDNMYFGNAVTSVAPALSNFTIPNKNTSDSDFSITAPTSTSPGSFTYSSSNTDVATIISGNMIHIVGAGTTTITATQAASGNYLSGSITASLVVSQLAQSPISAAPNPPSRNAWDVVSVFSGAYNTITGTNFYPDWGQGTTYEQLNLGTPGNATIHYSNLDYQGINLVPDGNPGINVLSMTKLHIDIWTPNVSPINIYLIAGGENSVTLTPTLSGWNSFDIDLSDYSNQGRNLGNVIQLKIEKPGFSYHAETNSVYFDNIYFWRPTTNLPTPTLTSFNVPNKVLGDASFTITPPTSNSSGAFTYTSSNIAVATVSGNTVTIVGAGSTIITATQAASGSFGAGTISATMIVSYPPPTTNAPIPTVPADRVLSLFSNTYTNVAGTNWFPNWGQSTLVSDFSISNNNIKKYEFLNYQGVEFASPVNASNMTTLHIDVWTPNCTTFEVYLINTTPSTVQQSVSLNPTVSGWNSFDISLAQYTNIALNNIGQLMFIGTPSGTSSVYLDNIYFYKPSPTIAAPTVVSPVNYCKGDIATPLRAGIYGNTLKWYTAATGGTASLTAPTPLTTTAPSTKTYYVSEVFSNGVEGPRASIVVNVNALPTAPTTLTGTAAVGPLVGTTTTATFTTTAVSGATSYLWTVPAGVTIVSGQGTT